jgi:hypothetical protein
MTPHVGNHVEKWELSFTGIGIQNFISILEMNW